LGDWFGLELSIPLTYLLDSVVLCIWTLYGFNYVHAYGLCSFEPAYENYLLFIFSCFFVVLCWIL